MTKFWSNHPFNHLKPQMYNSVSYACIKNILCCNPSSCTNACTANRVKFLIINNRIQKMLYGASRQCTSKCPVCFIFWILFGCTGKIGWARLSRQELSPSKENRDKLDTGQLYICYGKLQINHVIWNVYLSSLTGEKLFCRYCDAHQKLLK